MPLSGHGRAGCCPVFTGCRYSLIQDRIVCKTNYDMFVFGQAPAGFAQVETPYLYCTAVGSLPSGSFTNVADAGGVYNGQWVQAVSRWVTTVYGKPEPLPRTGY